jgi:hypothetical protein
MNHRLAPPNGLVGQIFLFTLGASVRGDPKGDVGSFGYILKRLPDVTILASYGDPMKLA